MVLNFLGFTFPPAVRTKGRRRTDTAAAERVTTLHTIAIGRGLRAVQR